MFVLFLRKLKPQGPSDKGQSHGFGTSAVPSGAVRMSQLLVLTAQMAWGLEVRGLPKGVPRTAAPNLHVLGSLEAGNSML